VEDQIVLVEMEEIVGVRKASKWKCELAAKLRGTCAARGGAVTLNNGSIGYAHDVIRRMLKLEELRKENPKAFCDLISYYRNDGYGPDSDNLPLFKWLMLVLPMGDVILSLKNIILSGVAGEAPDMILINPIARGAAPVPLDHMEVDHHCGHFWSYNIENPIQSQDEWNRRMAELSAVDCPVCRGEASSLEMVQ
jgi:hypothetical protein